MMGPKFKNIPKKRPAQTAAKEVVQAQLYEAITLHQQGRLLEAKAVYEAIVQGNPRHFDALHMLGVVADQTKNHQVAAELIDKAIEINPNIAAAYYNRGNALLALKQLEGALTSFDRAIELKPDYAEAHSNKGIALATVKQFTAALECFDRAIFIKSNFVYSCVKYN